MSETFIILERAGNGYIMQPTEGRNDQGMRVITIRGDLTVQSGTLELETDLDPDEWVVIACSGRIINHSSTGVEIPSATGKVRGMNSNVRSTVLLGVDRWFLDVDFHDGDIPNGDQYVVTALGVKTAQVSRSNIANN